VLLRALGEQVERPDAAQALLLPPSVAAAALASNRRAASSGTRPAVQRYAGVVYEGLAVDQLSAAAQRLARRELLVFSGLFGVLRGGDPVPDYRVPAKAVLPEIGVVATSWRPVLSEALPGLLDRGPIIDLRSTDYGAMWQPAPHSDEAKRLIGVRILSPTPAGGVAVVSYPSKLAKGRLAAALLERRATGGSVASVQDLLEVWTLIGGRDCRSTPHRRGWTVELVE
jgi:cytoplasmic iron level regulating protein YaaA (DUF328/UPF0246 family)